MDELQTSLGSEVLVPGWVPPGVDITVAHPARIYDALIGGKDNFAPDRAAAEAAVRAVPQAAAMAKANRAFLGRAVRYLAEAGVTQFLDIGTGIPGPGNTGEIARQIAPNARVAYIDYDPIVATHTRALLAEADPALTAVVLADVREPKSIIDNTDIRRVLDFDQPIGILMIALMHFISPEEDPAGLIAAYVDAVAPGSALALTHITPGGDAERNAEARKAWNKAKSQLVSRSAEEVTTFFAGLDVVDPGVVRVHRWHPDASVDQDFEVLIHGGVGFKR